MLECSRPNKEYLLDFKACDFCMSCISKFSINVYFSKLYADTIYIYIYYHDNKIAYRIFLCI